MEKYRKSDQHYIDEYDKRTIFLLKELERKEAMKRNAANSLKEKQRFIIEEYASLDSFFHNAVIRARNKEDSIRTSIQRDEDFDHLVAKYPEPRNINCKTCNSLLFVHNHIFKEGAAEILFVLECPQGHSPRRVFYPNGKEFHFPERRCEKCTGELHSTTKKTKTKLTFIETCKNCKTKKVDEIAILKGADASIDEEERKKYCTAYVSQSTFWEDLKEVAGLAKSFEEQRKKKLEKEAYGFNTVHRIRIPLLEQRILQLTEKEGYTKFSFEKPVFTKHTLIHFSVQDPTDRSEKESIKQLQKALQVDLFETNWRLVSADLTYRMGYLTGKIKGFEQDDDIMKIAREIHKKARLNNIQ